MHWELGLLCQKKSKILRVNNCNFLRNFLYNLRYMFVCVPKKEDILLGTSFCLSVKKWCFLC